MEVKNEVCIKPYNCEICNRDFTRKDRLQCHNREVHSINKKYQCTKCEQLFQNQQNLNSHNKRVHLKERDFKCEICGASFFRKTCLSIHTQRLHSSIDKKEICNFCGESFVDLKTHVKRVHTSSQRKPCNFCGKTFSSNNELNRHFATFHNDTKHCVERHTFSFPKNIFLTSKVYVTQKMLLMLFLYRGCIY